LDKKEGLLFIAEEKALRKTLYINSESAVKEGMGEVTSHPIGWSEHVTFTDRV